LEVPSRDTRQISNSRPGPKADVLLRPKNFVRHFQGLDIKCKLPLSTHNLAFVSVFYSHFDNLSFSPSVQILRLQRTSSTLTQSPHDACGTRGRLATIFGVPNRELWKLYEYAVV
jgi:hypothetical protein